MTRDELVEVLRLHAMWINDPLTSTRANLEGANLYRANLEGAKLEGANLEGANLEGANLYGAKLEGANLYGANLYGAKLEGANLEGANLYGANLYGAKLEGAKLEGANLEGAKLYGANLYGAKLEGANLEGAKLTHCIPDERGVCGLALRGLKWPVYVHPSDGTLSVGCQTLPIVQWSALTSTDTRIIKMHPEAAEFWARHKELILMIATIRTRPVNEPPQ